MMMRTRRFGLALVLVLLAGSGLRDDDAAEVAGDLKAMQGAWVNTPDSDNESRWVIDGDLMKSTVNDVRYVAKITLDPQAKPHPTIDIAVTDGPENSMGKTSQGIYNIKGDRLTLCVALPGRDLRPVEFKAVQKESFLFGTGSVR